MGSSSLRGFRALEAYEMARNNNESYPLIVPRTIDNHLSQKPSPMFRPLCYRAPGHESASLNLGIPQPQAAAPDARKAKLCRGKAVSRTVS